MDIIRNRNKGKAMKIAVKDRQGKFVVSEVESSIFDIKETLKRQYGTLDRAQRLVESGKCKQLGKHYQSSIFYKRDLKKDLEYKVVDVPPADALVFESTKWSFDQA